MSNFSKHKTSLHAGPQAQMCRHTCVSTHTHTQPRADTHREERVLYELFFLMVKVGVLIIETPQEKSVRKEAKPTHDAPSRVNPGTALS